MPCPAILLIAVVCLWSVFLTSAINWGLSGPMLRGSGVKWDLRKVDHYECYDDFDWDVQWETATEYNFGVDASFLDGRLNFSAEYYNKTNTDMLLLVGYLIGIMKRLIYIVSDSDIRIILTNNENLSKAVKLKMQTMI